MSAPDDLPIQSEPDRMAGWWMDGDAETGEEPATGTAEPLPDRRTVLQADLQLLHAMLLHLDSREASGQQARIERAMRAIGQMPTDAVEQQPATVETPSPPRRLLRWVARWAVAASVLIAVLTWLHVSTSNPASAALDRVVQALDDPVDRTYEIAVEPTDAPPKHKPRHRPQEGGPGDPPPEDRRPGLNGAILFIRGKQFVLYRSTPAGELLVNGSNGSQNWLIRPERPVLVSDDLSAFRVPMPENLATIPFVDVRQTLNSLRYGYEIEVLPAEQIDGDPTGQWRLLRARKIDPATKGPRAISVWFHPTTHLIRQIRFEQVNLQGRPQPRRLTISLASTRALPANWFDHDAHHAPNASVERVSP